MIVSDLLTGRHSNAWAVRLLWGGGLLLTLLVGMGCTDASSSHEGAYGDFDRSIPIKEAHSALYRYPLSHAADSTTSPPYYHLNVYVMGSYPLTMVNGVWLRHGKKRIPFGTDAPTDRLLREGQNRVTVALLPGLIPVQKVTHVDSLRPATVDEAEVTVTLRRHQTRTGGPETGTIVATKTLDDVIAHRRAAAEVPVTFPIELHLTADLGSDISR